MSNDHSRRRSVAAADQVGSMDANVDEHDYRVESTTAR